MIPIGAQGDQLHLASCNAPSGGRSMKLKNNQIKKSNRSYHTEIKKLEYTTRANETYSATLITNLLHHILSTYRHHYLQPAAFILAREIINAHTFYKNFAEEHT